MPQPKGKKKKKKEVEEGAAAGGESPEPGEGKKKGKKKAKKVEGPEFPKMQYGPELTPEQALSTATSWKYKNIIDAKKSSGNLSTASFYQKVATFDKLNPLKVRSHVLP